MPDPDALSFFEEKRPWSKYKDLILHYYLKPYLAKVARLNRPILVVDCFAGAGKFEDGNPGSPLLICDRLAEAHDRGAPVLGMFIENLPELYDRLASNLSAHARVPIRHRFGSFRGFISEIEELAASHTVFLYLDPLKPSHLLFDDMKPIYEMLQRRRSVEALINFLSPRMIRIAQGMEERTMEAGARQLEHWEVKRCNEICGGNYWEDALKLPSQAERVEYLAEGYKAALHRYFRYVMKYPVKENYKDELPQYHLMFGSRIADAVELMNNAMVTARREFVVAEFPAGKSLFDETPEEEIVNPKAVQRAVVETSMRLGLATWLALRTQAIIDHPSKYKVGDFNKGIKDAIAAGDLLSTCNGKTIDEDADIWVPTELDLAGGSTSPCSPFK